MRLLETTVRLQIRNKDLQTVKTRDIPAHFDAEQIQGVIAVDDENVGCILQFKNGSSAESVEKADVVIGKWNGHA